MEEKEHYVVSSYPMIDTSKVIGLDEKLKSITRKAGKTEADLGKLQKRMECAEAKVQDLNRHADQVDGRLREMRSELIVVNTRCDFMGQRIWTLRRELDVLRIIVLTLSFLILILILKAVLS